MKKIIITVFILLIAFTGFAQGFYLRLGVGYAFPEAGQTIDGTGQPYNGSSNNSATTETYNLKAASFSAGFQGTVALGYMLSKHAGIQLDANLGLAGKKYTFDDENVTVGGTPSNVSVIQQAKSPFIVMPALVLQTGGEPWNLYCRMGLAVPISTKITEDQVISNAPGTGALEIDDYTFQIKNSFSLGFTAAAGVQYKLNDKVSIWGEISLLSMSVYIKESDLTNVTSNGQNIPLSQVSGPQMVKYSRNASTDSNMTVQPAYSQPFSNVGINIGICFKLGDQSHSNSHRNEDIDDTKPFRRH